MVGAELGSAVVGQQREEQRAEHTALWGPIWSGSSVLGMLVLMLCMISLSKHFIMTGVSAMGR